MRRLTVPLLPPPEQRRYGAAFRQLHAFRASGDEFASFSANLARLLGRTLADGGLLPPAAGERE